MLCLVTAIDNFKRLETFFIRFDSEHIDHLKLWVPVIDKNCNYSN